MRNKSAVCLLLLTATISLACADTSVNPMPAPVLDQTEATAPAPVKTRYISVAMPGEMMPIQSLSSQQKSQRRLSGLSAVEVANKKAERQPLSSRYINAIMTYEYMPGALYQIYCEPLDVTDLQFQMGEHIISVAAGDTLRWQVSKTYSGAGLKSYEHLLIKPIDSGLTNSLVVTTDLRTYHLQLHSTDSAYMASVNWNYPESEDFVRRYQSASPDDQSSNVSQALSLSGLDFNYQANLLSGKESPTWMPWMVFNDGNKTYIQFPPHMQIAPTLFIGPDPAHARIVNYRVEGKYYIIDQVVDSLILRVGQTDPTVVQVVHEKS